MLFTFRANAETQLEIQGTYLSDVMSGTKQPSYSNQFYTAMIMFSIDASKTLSFGMGYNNVTTPWTNNGVTNTLSGSDLGPAVKWDFCKRNMCSLAFTYGILNKSTYVQSSGSYSWQGTSYLYQATLQPELSDHWRILVSMVYYYTNITSQVFNNITSGISVQHNATYPIFGLLYEW